VALLALPPLLAAAAVYRTLRRYPTTRWDDAALRGVGAGLGCAAAFAVLAVVSRGAVGPGRMTQVGPFAFQVLLHGIATFGLGGLVGSMAATWRARHS
jgi:drug/metabolite transporter (DMT)-like permease